MKIAGIGTNSGRFYFDSLLPFDITISSEAIFHNCRFLWLTENKLPDDILIFYYGGQRINGMLINPVFPTQVL
jgi:hypothetical protein